MDKDTTVRRSRRAVLGAAIGGAAAVAASAVARPLSVSAADGDNALLGQDNTSTTVTSFENTAADDTSLQGTHTGSGTGVQATSATGPGLIGISTDSTPSDFGGPSHRNGVWGAVGDTSGATPNSDEAGVYGYADLSYDSAGVVGESFLGYGVFGVADWGVYGTGNVGVIGDVDTTGVGVYGFTGSAALPMPPAGVGVYAAAGSTSQTALQVSGKVKFSRSGRTSFGSTATSKKITMTGVTSSSYVIATMQTNVSGLYVRAVACGTGYFYIYLSKAPGKTAYAAYMVIN